MRSVQGFEEPDVFFELTMNPRSEFTSGILYILSACFCYSLVALLVALLQARIPLPQMLVIQNIFSLFFILPSFRNQSLASKFWKITLLRGVIGFAGIFAFYSSLKYLDFGDAVVLSYASNLLIPVLSCLFLGEASSKKIWWPIGLGFVGVVILLRPSWSMIHPGSIFALISAGTSAASMTIVRYLNVKGESQTRIIFYLFFTSAILALPLALYKWTPIQALDWVLLFFIGATLGANQLFLTKGLKKCPTPILVPFSYSTILYGALFDWIIWKKGLEQNFILGATLIMAGGILVYRIQTKNRISLPTS